MNLSELIAAVGDAAAKAVADFRRARSELEAENDQAAIKIAAEKHAQYKASQEGLL